MPKQTYMRSEPDPILLELGQMLRKYRKKAGLGQGDVAQKLGRSQVTVNNWETGWTSPPFLDVKAYCELVGLDLWPTPIGGF